jgi:hypothetical protein
VKIELLSQPAKVWAVQPHEDFEPGDKHPRIQPNIEVWALRSLVWFALDLLSRDAMRICSTQQNEHCQL